MKYNCLGSWLDENENNVAALAAEKETREYAKYRCILTRRDEPYRMVYSRTAECKYLKVRKTWNARLGEVVYVTYIRDKA